MPSRKVVSDHPHRQWMIVFFFFFLQILGCHIEQYVVRLAWHVVILAMLHIFYFVLDMCILLDWLLFRQLIWLKFRLFWTSVSILSFFTWRHYHLGCEWMHYPRFPILQLVPESSYIQIKWLFASTNWHFSLQWCILFPCWLIEPRFQTAFSPLGFTIWLTTNYILCFSNIVHSQELFWKQVVCMFVMHRITVC